MSITQEEIRKISHNLTKLEARNENKLVTSTNSILNYVELMNDIDTSTIIPTISVITKNENDLREDKEHREIETLSLLKCSSQKIIANQIAINDIMK